MKITFIIGNWVNLSGGNRVISIYADRLQKRGHDVFVVCPEKPQPSFCQQIRSLLKGKGWISTKLEGPSHFDHLNVPRKVLSHGPPVTDEDLPDGDVVIATWWETAEWVAKLSPNKGAKAYFIQHHEVHDYIPKERASATYLLPLHKITISKWLVDLMATQYKDKNVSLVLNSVDNKLFYAPPRSKQSIPTVGLLYSTTYWKGCEISFKAIALARQQIPQLQVIAFGTQEPSPTLPLPDGTKYIQNPEQESIRDIYGRCDVWLCGSYYEGFHLPPLEAMACRCPVVSTEVGGPIDRLKNGVNGYLVPVGDYQALAECLIKIVQLSEADWQRISEAAYQTANSYSWDDATDLFEAALERAIERTQSGDLACQ